MKANEAPETIHVQPNAHDKKIKCENLFKSKI